VQRYRSDIACLSSLKYFDISNLYSGQTWIIARNTPQQQLAEEGGSHLHGNIEVINVLRGTFPKQTLPYDFVYTERPIQLNADVMSMRPDNIDRSLRTKSVFVIEIAKRDDLANIQTELSKKSLHKDNLFQAMYALPDTWIPYLEAAASKNWDIQWHERSKENGHQSRLALFIKNSNPIIAAAVIYQLASSGGVSEAQITDALRNRDETATAYLMIMLLQSTRNHSDMAVSEASIKAEIKSAISPDEACGIALGIVSCIDYYAIGLDHSTAVELLSYFKTAVTNYSDVHKLNSRLSAIFIASGIKVN